VSRPLAAGAFALAAVILLAGFALYAARGLQLRDPLRLALALLALGFAVALAYEAASIATGADPTISAIVADEFARHPVVYLAIFIPLMVLAGGLAAHFTLAAPGRVWWLVVAAGVAAYVAGAVLVDRLRLLP
jgi:hypothetical protein